jgi:heparinase II/III-like protein/zinc carboxypeptidase
MDVAYCRNPWRKIMRIRNCTRCSVLILAFYFCLAGKAISKNLPEWTGRIRSDHPRLFFNTQTWPAVQARAQGAEKDWYLNFKKRVDRLLTEHDKKGKITAQELGPQAAWSAFVFLLTEDKRYLELSKKCLTASLDYYDQCYQQRKSVNWYSTSRVHAILAWDWLYNHLTEPERKQYMSRLVRAIDKVVKARPTIYRENMSGYNTGFYGVRNCLWFLGCTAYETGIETDKVNEWLVWGHDENLKLLEHRRKACGNDGGGASGTLGYVLGAYPWSEQNFFYTWLSSTGENIAPDWLHSAYLANYVIWNWIASDQGPLEFGYGDTPHTSNRMPVHQLYTHMANIRHLYGRQTPQAAALARHLQEALPQKSYSSSWFIYPFLLTNLDKSPPPFVPETLPHARHFETMGQIIMRSGTGKGDTYCLFSCGGTLAQHRHFDALNFVIYHRGFLALDSGTRYKEFDNGEHLANYYAQTVAHNCVVIHQPGEPPARYWGGKVVGNHGGQHKQLGSVVKAFETNGDYVYVAGDATACYQHGQIKRTGQPDLPEKCEQVTRQVVFLMPNHFVIFDRVKSTEASYRKDWLLHTAYKPVIKNKTIQADHREGRMLCQTILPTDAKLTSVGGPGKEFHAASKNWEIKKDKLKPDQLALMGQWRVEVSPDKLRKEDVFLHVIQVGDQKLKSMDAVQKIENEAEAGVRITTQAGTWQVVFHKTGSLGGHIKRIGGNKNINALLPDQVQKQVGIASRPYPAMTFEQAKHRIPKRDLPKFWIGDIAGLTEKFAKLKTGMAKVIAHSPGGRPMHLVTFGDKELLPNQANYNSAIGGRKPTAYMNKAARSKPVILLVGPVHGHEVEALTGLVNLIQVMETGRDLRGKEQTALQELGRQCRLLIIPEGNPDGIARFEPRSLLGMNGNDLRFWGQGTWSDDTFCGWPESKQQHPMIGANVGFLGCYFNDKGVNPMHDEFLAPINTEAPAILQVAKAEGPDLAVSLHSHGNKPVLLRPAYVTMEAQEEIRALAKLFNELMDQRKLPHGGVFTAKPEGGRTPSPFNLTSALYHISGANSFTFECPHGLSEERYCKVTLDQILDIQLTLYEAMIRYELQKKQL